MDGVYSHAIGRCLLLGRKAVTNLDSILKNLETSLSDKGPYSQSYGFSSNHVQMWELDCKEGWAQKNWCFHNVVLEKTLESPLDCKEIKPVNSKGNQPWIFRTDSGQNIWKDWRWSWSSNTWATWSEEPPHWKRPWCWERLKAKGEEVSRGWDG